MRRFDRIPLPALLLLAASLLAGCAFDTGGAGEVRAAPRTPGESHFATYLKYRSGEGGVEDSAD